MRTRSQPWCAATGRWCWRSAAASSATPRTPRTPSRPRSWSWLRKAASVGDRDAVAGWLYRVAYHAALAARAHRSRRAAKERQVEAMPQPVAPPENDQRELLELLDRELARLPEKYRLPVVLCELEGTQPKGGGAAAGAAGGHPVQPAGDGPQDAGRPAVPRRGGGLGRGGGGCCSPRGRGPPSCPPGCWFPRCASPAGPFPLSSRP